MNRVIAYILIISSPLYFSVFPVPTAAEEASYYAGNNEVIHVGGKVLCQDCTLGYNEWVHDAKPLQGSKVSVTCLDDRSRVVYYESDQTDVAGDFDIQINKYYGKELKPQNCYLRLVSSSDLVCNIATDFNGGKSGVKLRQPNVIYRDTVKYTVGPFYYTTPMCDEPDSSSTNELSSQDGKY